MAKKILAIISALILGGIGVAITAAPHAAEAGVAMN
jgi:hypothetical protein